MELPLGVEMNCTDGKCGRSTYLIINPVSMELTHVVMRMAPAPHTQYIVPLDWIEESSPKEIHLRCTMKGAMQLPVFIDTEYIELPAPLTKADARSSRREQEVPNELPSYLTQEDMATWSRVRAHPFVVATKRFDPDPLEHLPDGEIAVKRGAEVQATDGKIGRVDEFLVDPETLRITHLVLREATPLARREVSVPVSAIDSIYETTVYLKLAKKEVKALPTLPIERPWP